VIALLLACAPEVPWADVVVSAPGADDSVFGDPERAANGARGGGCCQGSIDVYSLSPTKGRTELVLGFAEPVFDGTGDDLVVFENPFEIRDAPGRFMDPVVVSVSHDGESWATFPHEYRAADPAAWSADPEDWVGFAGTTPTLLDEQDNPVDAFDREAAGGDGFDLASLPEDGLRAPLLESGVLFVRLVPAALVENPETGSPYPADPVSDGPDIDAVYGR
jgi:hypothetical protein